MLARQRAALFVALVLLTGCGVRVSLGDYGFADVGGPDGGAFDLDAEDPFDGESLDALAEAGPEPVPDASDDVVDEVPLGDAAVD